MEKNIEQYMSEFLANHDRQALSDDAAEQVVGGELAGLFLNGKFVDEETVYNLFLNMADLYGYDIAANVFCESTGFSKVEINKAHRGGASDKENMYCLITQCFTTFSKIEGGGKTF
ncbi:MAG: hypothetical protein II875_00340 [Clostridia bacterium]|nr:hypothetical protein [Clostridia bacterium]